MCCFPLILICYATLLQKLSKKIYLGKKLKWGDYWVGRGDRPALSSRRSTLFSKILTLSLSSLCLSTVAIISISDSSIPSIISVLKFSILLFTLVSRPFKPVSNLASNPISRVLMSFFVDCLSALISGRMAFCTTVLICDKSFFVNILAYLTLLGS